MTALVKERATAECVLVVGAGAGGIAAALSLARRGVPVLLVEKSRRLGGTVARSLIHTIGGLFDSEGAFINEGLPAELAQRLFRSSPTATRRRMGRLWVLNVAPEDYERVVTAWLTEEPLLSVIPEATVARIACEYDRITKIGIVQGNRTLDVTPIAVVDATGQAEIVRRVDSRLVSVEPAAAAGLICTLQPVDTAALQFPRNVELLRAIREAARGGELPADCEKAWLDVGVHEREAYVKLFVPMGAAWQANHVQQALLQNAYRQRDSLIAFLQGLVPFVDSELKKTGELGIRHGGSAVGNYLLTATDVREARKFDDAAAACAWPIEYWDPEKGVQLEHLPRGAFYEIPIRSLQVKGRSDLWVAGKCLSADRYAQASARIAGCCWAMGDAVGKYIAERPSLGSD